MHSTAIRSALTLAAVAVVGVGALGPVAQAKPPSTPAIPLNNEQETTGATGGASGFFAYTIDDATNRFCYTLTVEGLTAPATAAHIHVGRRNTAPPGNVVIPLAIPNATSFTVTNVCTTISDDLATAILSNPRGYYVNVHTQPNPGGEIRGQLK